MLLLCVSSHEPLLVSKPCGTGAVDGTYERSQNFKKVLETFFADDTPEVPSLGSYSSSTAEDSTPGLNVVPSNSSLVAASPADANSSYYFCNERTSLPSDAKPVDIVYEYEVVISQSINLQNALVEVNEGVMSSLADSLDCTTASIRRGLMNNEQNTTLIGIKKGIDMIDANKESCTKASFNDCIPIISHVTGFFDRVASADDVLEVLEVQGQILSIIQKGMQEGRYNSDQIRWIVFSSELGQDDSTLPSLESVYVMPQGGSGGTVWVPIASTLICALIIAIAICVVLIVKEKKKKGVTSNQVLPEFQSVSEKP